MCFIIMITFCILFRINLFFITHIFRLVSALRIITRQKKGLGVYVCLSVYVFVCFSVCVCVCVCEWEYELMNEWVNLLVCVCVCVFVCVTEGVSLCAYEGEACW